MDISFDLVFFALVSMRLTGCIMFNPILGRRNLPASLKAGLIVILTLLVCSVIPMQTIEVVGLLHFFVLVAKELLIGFIIGLIVRMFFSIVSVGGEVIDMQIGLSMAKKAKKIIDISREDIERYITENNLQYVTDSIIIPDK